MPRVLLDLPAQQIAALRTLASRRGEKDLSPLVQEAIDRSLEARSALLDAEQPPEPPDRRAVADALAVLGSLDDDAADALVEVSRGIRESGR